MSKEQRVDLPGEVDGPEPGDHQLRQHHAGHAHHLPVRHHGGMDTHHVLGEEKNLEHFEGSRKYIALFHFDFVPLLCFVPSLIHQVEEVVPVYLQLWPTNPERENCLSLKEQILATFSFFSAEKYILLCSCLTQCRYSNFCISENPITYIKSPLCTKFRGFTK